MLRTKSWHILCKFEVIGSSGRLVKLPGRGVKMLGVLWAVFVVVLALWLLGLVFNIVGGAIHFLLVVAAIILIYNLVAGNKNRISN